jgi:glutamyl-tRNA synthetase
MVRVRFAPSPTGALHVGGLRTALYNYLLAKRHGGKFLLRIEDTDQGRFVPGSVEVILSSLAWAGITVDEGVGCSPEGPHGPYSQSQRLSIYRKHAQRLLDQGLAYRCFATAEELTKMRESHGGYDRRYRDVDPAQGLARAEAGEPHVIRMKVPFGEKIVLDDVVRGEITFETDIVDDQVILKSDGFPTYHLAAVVDDHEMEITHVIRGEEWLSSSPKHLLLYRFFGWQPPRFAHLPLIVSLSGKKLSKRDGDVSVQAYRDQGFLPLGLVNFLALLGWSAGDDREVYDMPSLEQAFALERVSHSASVFDQDKLRYINAQHLHKLDDAEVAKLLPEWFEKAGVPLPPPDYLVRVVGLMKLRCNLLPDFVTSCGYFYADPTEMDPATLKKRWKPESAELLLAYAERIGANPGWEASTLEADLRAECEERGQGAAALIHPVRLAVSGTGSGPGLFEMLEVLGRETCLRRLKTAPGLVGG